MEVRFFAGLRDATGTRRLESDAPDLATLLSDLRDRFGEPFVSRLEVSSVVIDGEPTATDADVSLAGVDEVALLPPFSGG